MLETAVCDGAEKFRLQEEVPEAGGVNADIRALLVDALAGGGLFGLLAGGGSGAGIVVKLVVRVVDKILLGRHGG